MTQSIHLLGIKWAAIGINEYYRNPLAIGKKTDLIYEKSWALKNRNKTSYDRDVHDTLAMHNPLVKSTKEKMVEYAFKPMAMLDQAVANPVWLGAYLKAIRQDKMSEADAVAYADSIVRLSQPTGVTKDMSRAQRGWGYGDAGKLLTMFSTFFSGTHNLMWGELRHIKRHADNKEYAQGAYHLGRSAMLLAVLPALFDYLIKEGPPEDEDDLIDIAKGVVSYAAGGMPVVRDAVSYWLGRSYQFRPAPIVGSVESLLKVSEGLVDLATGQDGGAAKLIRASGTLFGAPSSQILTTMKGVENWDENEGWEAAYRLLVRESPKKEKSK